MHETCPECGLPFSRGPGYFFGAMYFSYGLGILSALPTSIVLVVKQVEPIWVGLVVTGQLTLLSPILFRYSRVVWMYFDQWLDPR